MHPTSERGTTPADGSVIADKRNANVASNGKSFVKQKMVISTVIVRKDDSGYGMKVSGDNPVYVQSVRAGGAAEKAGLQAGDTIMKVNGIDVEKSTHYQVVDLIKSATDVILTVQQARKDPIASPLKQTTPILDQLSAATLHQAYPMQTTKHSPGTTSQSSPPAPLTTHFSSPSIYHSSHHHSPARPLSHHNKSITGPQPVNNEKLLQKFGNERTHTLGLMLEKEQRHLEVCRSDLANMQPNSDEFVVKQNELKIAERTVDKIQSELLKLNSRMADNNNEPSTTIPTQLTKSSNRYHTQSSNMLNSDYHHSQFKTSLSSNQLADNQNNISSPALSPTRLSFSPPPLPERNRPVVARPQSLTKDTVKIFKPPVKTFPKSEVPTRLDLPGYTTNKDVFVDNKPKILSPSSSSNQKDFKYLSPTSATQRLVPREAIVKSSHSFQLMDMPSVAKKTKNPSKKSHTISVDGVGLSKFYVPNQTGAFLCSPEGDTKRERPILISPAYVGSQSPERVGRDATVIDLDAVNSISKQLAYPLVSTCAALHSSSCNSKSPHLVQTHHRALSSPEPFQNYNAAKDTMNLLLAEQADGSDCRKPTRSDSWDILETKTCVTPPGTPPPPYPSPRVGRSPVMQHKRHKKTKHDNASSHKNSTDHSNHADEKFFSPTRSPTKATDNSELSALPFVTSSLPITAASSNLVQPAIISMEDELSDQEMEHLEDHGQFKSLTRLWEHLAHLSVFLNYILVNNCDPSSILFYLITDLYKEGNGKEMKKWAYEIHSSFLVPGSPLHLRNVDENVAREIDKVLSHEWDKEEILRKVFWKARAKAKEVLNELLAEFHQTRSAGLGTLYGPTDTVLDECIHDKSKESVVVEEVLSERLKPFIEDLDKEPVDPRKYTIATSLMTIFARIFGIKKITGLEFERCATFVSKDKSFRSRLIGRNKRLTSRGHQFVATQYYTVTYCNHCTLLIWGIGPQAFQCTNCHLNVHRHCVRNFDENCPGPLNKKERGADPISKFMGRIRSDTRGGSSDANRRKTSAFLQAERDKRLHEDRDNSTELEISQNGDKIFQGATTSVSRTGSDRRSDASETQEPNDADLNEFDPNNSESYRKSKSAQSSINRSESYKEQTQKRRQVRERRKISDPNLSKSNDVEPEAQQGLSYHTNSGSSSNSSISSGRSIDSPSTSLDLMSASHHHHNNVRIPEDSDVDDDKLIESQSDNWSSAIPEHLLAQLSICETKRQEVFSELLRTERSHVRQLRVLETIFHRPLLNNNLLTPDQISLLFPNLEKMLELHSGFSQSLKQLRKDNLLVSEVGDTLLSMFDGANGEQFEKAAAEFCARQQLALEWLRERRRKDAKLNQFLVECESDKDCQRFQLKDLIPTGMLRLTKYPLLFENLAKYTKQSLADDNPSNPALTNAELDYVKRAHERSKEILSTVNAAVREAENSAKLADIQKRLDRSGFDKVDHAIASEFKNIDLTKHRLIYDGALNWRINNRQRVNLHVLLLEDIIVLLQKQDEKYLLKFYHNIIPGSAERSITLSPIIKLSTVFVRPNATDNNAIYLIAQKEAQMYDLVASSSIESKLWHRHISETSESHNKREGRYSRTSTSELLQVDHPSPEHADDADKMNNSQTSISDKSDNNRLSTDLTTRVSSDPADPTVICSDDLVNSSLVNKNEKHTEEHDGDNKQQPVDNVHQSQTGGAHSHQHNDSFRSIKGAACVQQVELVQPNEVLVTNAQSSVQTAEEVLTHLGQLRRKDKVIKQALLEKQMVIADILNVPHEHYEHIADIVTEHQSLTDIESKEATELILAAITQGNNLVQLINDSCNVDEQMLVMQRSSSPLPDLNLDNVRPLIPSCPARVKPTTNQISVPVEPLQSISFALNTSLTQLLKILKEREEERDRLKRELHKAREQLHIFHEIQRLNPEVLLVDLNKPSNNGDHVIDVVLNKENEVFSACADEPCDDDNRLSGRFEELGNSNGTIKEETSEEIEEQADEDAPETELNASSFEEEKYYDIAEYIKPNPAVNEHVCAQQAKAIEPETIKDQT